MRSLTTLLIAALIAAQGCDNQQVVSYCLTPRDLRTEESEVRVEHEDDLETLTVLNSDTVSYVLYHVLTQKANGKAGSFTPAGHGVLLIGDNHRKYYVLTAAHLFDDTSVEQYVALWSPHYGSKGTVGRLIGADTSLDLALIEMGNPFTEEQQRLIPFVRLGGDVSKTDPTTYQFNYSLAENGEARVVQRTSYDDRPYCTELDMVYRRTTGLRFVQGDSGTPLFSVTESGTLVLKGVILSIYSPVVFHCEKGDGKSFQLVDYSRSMYASVDAVRKFLSSHNCSGVY